MKWWLIGRRSLFDLEVLYFLLFCQNNGEYFITVSVLPHGMIFTGAQDPNCRVLHVSTGVVTLVLPSTRPQLFENTVKLFSTGRARSRCVSCIHQRISVPGRWLEEYQEGYEIERPMKKIRPNGNRFCYSKNTAWSGW